MSQELQAHRSGKHHYFLKGSQFSTSISALETGFEAGEFFAEGDRPVYYKMFSSIHGLFSLAAIRRALKE